MTSLAATPTAGRLAAVQAIQARLARFPLPVLQLMMRISVGWVFFNAGLRKLDNWDITVMLFQEEYAVPVLPPELAAHLATAVELTMPVLLVAGLATRLATLPLLGMTLVIQLFVYPGSWPDHLWWTTMLLFLLTRGPGALSLDHVAGKAILGR